MLCEELISTPSGKSRHRDPFRGLVVDVVPPMQLAKGFIEVRGTDTASLRSRASAIEQPRVCLVGMMFLFATFTRA